MRTTSSCRTTWSNCTARPTVRAAQRLCVLPRSRSDRQPERPVDLQAHRQLLRKRAPRSQQPHADPGRAERQPPADPAQRGVQRQPQRRTGSAVAGADRHPSSVHLDSQFTKGKLFANLSQRLHLGEATYQLNNLFYGQYSRDPLPGVEWLSLTDRSAVRGFAAAPSPATTAGICRTRCRAASIWRHHADAASRRRRRPHFAASGQLGVAQQRRSEQRRHVALSAGAGRSRGQPRLDLVESRHAGRSRSGTGALFLHLLINQQFCRTPRQYTERHG